MRKRFLCCFIFFLLCLIFTRIVSASNDSEIVDVVVYGGYEKGYFEETEDGYSGFYPEYLESIKEENWTYNYHIPTGDAYTFLDSNDYDIIIGCPSESKKTNYVFSDVPIYAKHSVVAFQGSNSNMQIDNEFSMLNKWIGYYDDAEAEIFKLFCKVYNINYSNSSDPTILQLGLKSLSKADIYTKLENGTVDAILISDSLALEKEYKAVVSYSSKNVYLAANKNRNNKFLLAQENINDNKKENALFAKEIYDNIFYSVYNADLVISEEEQRILEEGISVRVGLLNNFSPYSFINSKNVATGLIIEALNEITLDTEEKINFTYKFYDSIAEINEAIEFGKCDISFLSFCDKEEITTKTFYSDKYVLYTSSNKKNIKVAVTSNISSSILEEFDIEKSNIKIYSNDEACLKACESGEVGYVISLKNVASYYINKNSLKAIILEVESENAFDFSLVSNDISDQALFSIINRSVDENYTKMLNDKLVELMIVDHNVKSFKDYIREHGTLILMWVILISTALILLLSIIIILLVVNSKKKYRLMYYDEVIDSENYQKFLLDAKKYISSNKKLAILYFDIRNFKYINSNFGTITGDMLLRDIAKYANILFKNLCFSRIYADKFVFLMEYEEEQEYKKRLQDSLKEFSGYTKEKYTNFNVFLKAGVYFADNSSDLEQAINLANYAAGESNVMSKNYVEYYNSDIYNQVVLEKDIERTMHHALEEKEFVTYYQPKIDIDTKKIVGAEALVRWNHRERGLLSPSEFVPIFEKNGFIMEIDFYVYESTCKYLKKIMDNNEKLIPISCNFSRRHLSNPTFVESLNEILNKYGIPAELIEIELTETMATENFDKFTEVVNKLKVSGYKISIDDFGSGYSSVQLLYDLPIDVLKLDKSFIQKMNENTMEDEIITSVIDICHKHDIKIICEGVETLEQEEYVRNHHCKLVQGYLYSKPIDESSFDKYRRNNS